MSKKKSYVILMAICVILFSGCQKKETVTEETQKSISYQEPMITEYESDGMTYEKMSGESIEVIYPKLDKTFSDEIPVTWLRIGGTGTSEMADSESAYCIKYMCNWEGLYTDENIQSIKYTIYNSTCGFVYASENIYNYRKKKSINMKSVSVSGSDTDALKLLIIAELPATDDEMNLYRQSLYMEEQAKIKAVNNALIEADIMYNDGTERGEYYKIKTGTHSMTLLDIYKQVE